MRRFLFGMVIASMTMATPGLVLGGDRDIAQAIMTRLEQQKAEGRLKGFDIDLEVKQSVVYLRGSVSTTQQLADVEAAAKQATGVTNVVNELKVSGEEAKAPGFSLKEALKAARPGTDSAVKPAAAVDTAAPALSDEQVTDAIIEQLQIEKKAGNLRGFQLDVRTVNGETWVGGRVANQAQRDLVLGIVKNTKGVKNILDEVSVNETAVVAAANTELTPVAPSSIPVMGGQAVPQAYAPSMLTAAQVGGAPVPMQSGAPVPYGAGVPRYDQPYMPSYAWPSYAAYPNYAAVTYPKQYSPSAWPYIGPFYPYPQVPLGWRKVTLEWDDGLWYLDFQSK
jgi:osmotically-inducible protein OsmY